MANRYIKKFLIFNAKAGTEVNHELYGIGKVIASYPMDGLADVQFQDGHIEYGFDIKAQINPEVIETEAFNCPITGNEVLAERCACAKGGIHACDYFKVDLEKKESACIYESEMQKIALENKDKLIREAKVSQEKQDAVNGLRNLITKYLKEAKFEDVLGPAPEGITAENKALYVQHKVTGTKGVISNIVASNAFEVTWKNQEEVECPCKKTVVTKEEIEKDSDASIWCKIKEVQEKLKKKFVKPINEFFKKKASVEDNLIKIDADKILSKLTVMPEVKKQSYLQAVKAQLNSIGVDVEDQSIVLNDKGVAESFNLIKSNSNDIYPEYLNNVSRKSIAQQLGYEGDVLKIYASLKGQLNTSCSENELKNFIENDLSKDNNLNTLF